MSQETPAAAPATAQARDRKIGPVLAAALALVFNLWLVTTGDALSPWLAAGLILVSGVLWLALVRRRSLAVLATT